MVPFPLPIRPSAPKSTAWALLGALALSCATQRHEPAPSAGPTATAEARPLPAGSTPTVWEDTREVRSNAGTYLVRFRSEPEEIPTNELFALGVWVLDPGGEQPAEGVELAVDAAMPEHGHGMSRLPQVRRVEASAFEVDGMLFHMPGRWELYFDVRSGAVTERAQVEVVLE